MKALSESWKTIKLMRSLSEYKNTGSESEDEARTRLLKSFADKNGVQFKIAQYFDLSNSVEGLSLRDYALIPIEEVEQILEKELGFDKYSHLQIDWSYVKSASMGQVHLAQLGPEKLQVIVKVLYPEIKETVVSQIKGLELASFIPNAIMSKKYKLHMDEYLQKLKQILAVECDLQNEVKLRNQLFESMKSCHWIIVPRIIEGYSTSNVLVQEYYCGLDFDTFLKESSPDEQKKMGEILIQTFFHQIFVTGLLQGDTNKGNYLFHPSLNDPKITLIDYGNYFQLTSEFRKNLFSLIDALIEGRDIDPISYLVGLSFEEEKLGHFHKTLPLLAQKLFAPLISVMPFDLRRWRLSRDVDLILGEHKWWFRSAGGVEFFQLMKSMKGLFGMLEHMNVNFNWRQLFLTFTENLKKDLLIEHPAHQSEFKFTSLAKSIIIHVKEKGSDKVNLTLPAAALMNLKDLMEPVLIEDLESKGVDVDSVIKNAIAEGGYPGKLFQFEEGDKEIQISLR